MTERLRILVVEDDGDIVELIKSALSPDFECFSASNGLEGLQRALLGEPDLIVCDIMMPVMDGREFIRKIRGFPGFEQTPVVILSALGSHDQIKEGYDLGAALYFTKPIDPKRLRRNVELFIADHSIRLRPKRMTLGQIEQYENDHVSKNEPEPAGAEPKASPATPPEPPKPQPDPKAAQEAPIDKMDQVVKPSSRMAMASASLREAQNADRIRVLVVEDDPDAMKMMRVGLADRFEVLESPDGIDAIERAVRYKPDLFIIDGLLPKLTGYQLVLMLKKNRLFFKSPILFISGKASERDHEYVRKLGVTHFLAKPFTVKQLMDQVEDVVQDPSFSIQKNRISSRQAYLERFQNHEITRQPVADGVNETLADLERRALEKQLKRQLQ